MFVQNRSTESHEVIQRYIDQKSTPANIEIKLTTPEGYGK